MTGRPPTTALKITEALKANAVDGIGVADLAAYSGCSPKVVKQTVCRLRMSGHVIGSRRVNEHQVRYFYGSEKKLATRFIAPKPTPTREIVYQALVEAGDKGLSGAELKALCSTIHSAKNAFEELKASGRLFGCRWPGAESWRYYVTHEYLDAAYKEARAAFKPKVREPREPQPRKPKAPKPQKHQLLVIRPAKPKIVGPQGEVIIPENVKRTTCPSPTLGRFEPTRVEPYFSALTPGSYAAGDTWAARVYG